MLYSDAMEHKGQRAADVLDMRRAIRMVDMLRGQDRPRDAALVAAAAGFGLRIGDALSLTWDQVLGDTGEVRDTVQVREAKTTKYRTVEVFPFVARALAEWNREATPGEYIFAGKDGRPLARMTGYRIVKSAAKDMGLKGRITPHSLRKSFCDYAYSLTHDPVLTSRITGHSNPAQLLRYIGRTSESERQVWARMRQGLAKYKA